MTGQAGPAHDAFIRIGSSRQRIGCLQVVRMALVRVTLLTQERQRSDQQSVLIGTMWRMTVEAVFAHWCMLEDERPALLGMTLVAGLVDGIRLQQRVGDRAMRIVAVVAAHLPFGERHVRAAVELQADIFVARGAGLVDRCLGHRSLDRELGHRIVTIAAGKPVALVN